METMEFSQLTSSIQSYLASLARPEILGAIIILLLTALCWLVLAGRTKSTALRQQLAETRREVLLLTQENRELVQADTDHRVREAKLTTIIRSERKSSEEKLALLDEAREELRLQFANLAQEIFENKSQTFSSQSKERIEALLKPFHNQLGALQEEIRKTYLNDTRERTSLKSELDNLHKLNQRISQEAVNLTRALKGDKKLQGNWGEMILEKILEQSGLRNGHEYETQRGFRDSDGRLFKPDVIVRLPEGRDIVIDAKVSLVAWERYCNCSEEGDRRQAIRELATAIRNHITTLAAKNYEELTTIRSLDFVMMFMPIDAAFLTVMEADASLVNDALARKVVLVTPTTLLAALKTVENIWRYENQSKNSLEIARRAGNLYDKFRAFTEDLEKIGRQLDVCHAAYDSAMAKLTRGRGNLVSQAAQLTDLGIQVKKELPESLLEQSDRFLN